MSISGNSSSSSVSTENTKNIIKKYTTYTKKQILNNTNISDKIRIIKKINFNERSSSSGLSSNETKTNDDKKIAFKKSKMTPETISQKTFSDAKQISQTPYRQIHQNNYDQEEMLAANNLLKLMPTREQTNIHAQKMPQQNSTHINKDNIIPWLPNERNIIKVHIGKGNKADASNELIYMKIADSFQNLFNEAPDNQTKKNIIKIIIKTLSDNNFKFYSRDDTNLEITGKDLFEKITKQFRNKSRSNKSNPRVTHYKFKPNQTALINKITKDISGLIKTEFDVTTNISHQKPAAP